MKGVSGAKIKEGGMIEVDNQILLKLYSLYQKELYLYLYSLCGDRHLAEDLLYMVARNLFYNQQKKKSREILMDEQIYPLEEKTEKGLPEKIFEEEDRRMLYQAIRRLDIKKREIIQMQYFGGMTQKEIAAVLHITLENVRVLAYRARKELKKYLEECRKEESQ